MWYIKVYLVNINMAVEQCGGGGGSIFRKTLISIFMITTFG